MFKLQPLVIAVAALLPTYGIAAPDVLHSDMPHTRVESQNSWVEVNLAQFADNLAAAKQQVSSDTAVCAVMKGDAYGHGLVALMPAVIAQDVSHVAVTSNAELAAAREAGFTGTLLRVRTATPDEARAAMEYNTEEMVGDFEQAQAYGRMAKEANRTMNVHIVLDNGGMARNGVSSVEEAVRIAQVPGVKVVGIMTHFANNDRDEMAMKAKRFERDALAVIEQAKLSRDQVLLHSANSFATYNVPESHFDMVRPGSALYGYGPHNPDMQPIGSFKTRVAGVFDFKAGATVGYGSTVTLSRDSVLANLPLGYSDAYPRVMSNRGEVLIGGHRAPVIGLISMNTMMVDVTDLPDVKMGDEVVLFGKQGQSAITTQEWERVTGQIMAETFAHWGRANKRVFKN